MEHILAYLQQTYCPIGLIVYGSFDDHSNHDHSDFDALVITEQGTSRHDTTVIDGIPLDVFVEPRAAFAGDFDPMDYIQVSDGQILQDTDAVAECLQQAVRAAIRAVPPKTAEEKRTAIEWCEKMLLRTDRGDAEGYFRWHWLLTDSLEVYCELTDVRYRGPKKSLRQLLECDPAGYERYLRALSTCSREDLVQWVRYLREVYQRTLE